MPPIITHRIGHPHLTHAPKSMSFSELLNITIKIAQGAGELLAAEWLRPAGPRGCGDKAEVDLEIEVLLRAELLAAMDCDFWGEETGSRLTGTDCCWVVDPNDGTADFLRGRKGTALSVGLLMNAEPVLGVVYAPVTNDRGPDCIAWCEGLGGIYRNGQLLTSSINHRPLEAGSKVLVSTGALMKPKINEVLCAPAEYRPMPSIAYRLATAAAGDGVVAVSIVPVSAHDVVAGHAILRGAGGVLVDQVGEPITYESEAKFSKVSTRCFGGAPQACAALVGRDWGRVFA